MSELTAETVRTIVHDIVQNAIGGLRAEMQAEFKDVRREMKAETTVLDQKVDQLRQGTTEGFQLVNQKVDQLRRNTTESFQAADQKVDQLRQDTTEGFRIVDHKIQQLRQDTTDGLEHVLATVQAFHDEDQDTFAEIRGRLSYHNERIAKLERLNGLRA